MTTAPTLRACEAGIHCPKPATAEAMTLWPNDGGQRGELLALAAAHFQAFCEEHLASRQRAFDVTHGEAIFVIRRIIGRADRVAVLEERVNELGIDVHRIATAVDGLVAQVDRLDLDPPRTSGSVNP